MAFVIADRVRETSTTIGTGNFTLAGAVTGYQTFDAALDTGDTTYYTIADQSGSNWEVGIGTFTSPSTLARTTILSSSNGGSVVTFGAGTKDVFISLPASKTNTVEAGNLTFASTAQRITGDFSNGTQSNRVFFQTTTAGGGTSVGTIPNATGANSAFNAFGGPDPGNASFAQLRAGSDTSDVRLTSGITGTGTYYPMTFYTGGSERMRLDTSGNVGIGTSSPGVPLGVVANSGSNAIRLIGRSSDNISTLDFVPNNSASSYAYLQASSSYFAFGTSATERMRLDSSGNVGIGTSSPLRVLHVVSNAAETQLLLRESDSSGPQLLMGADSAVSGSIINASSVSGSNSNLLLQTGGTERARIDSNGNVQINTTNAAATGTTCRFTIQDGTTYLPFGINNNAAGTGASNVALFARNGTTTGTISVTGTTTAYNTSSDYRLKHDVQPMLSGLSTISALKPSTYKWNADNSYGEGFIAHELQAVIPQAVSGEKDAVNENGSIEPQGVDYSKIVVHLVAAIQELKADFDAYKAAHP